MLEPTYYRKIKFHERYDIWKKNVFLSSTGILLLVLITPSIFNSAEAHEGAGAGWLLSRFVTGDLSLQPDQSLPQWKETKAVNIVSLDGMPMTLRSVNNGSYVVFLVNRSLDSIDKSGMVMAFEGAGVNGSDAVWSIIDGAQKTPLDSTVKIRSSLEQGEFTATFGRELENGNFILKTGVQYDSFVKATSWNNGTNLDAIDLDSLKHWDFELLPPIDEYPKLPIAVSAVFLGAVALFIVYETRKQSN